MARIRIGIAIVIAMAVGAGFFVFPVSWNSVAHFVNTNISFIKLPEWHPRTFSYGLDLQGGTHLVYEAQIQTIGEADRDDALNSVRDVIERRVNLFGVAEPLVQLQNSDSERPRLIVELAGVSDVGAAIQEIGETPVLEFKELQAEAIEVTSDEDFINTGLTGRHLVKARLTFDQGQSGVGIAQPLVSLEFNEEGATLFEEITLRNIGRPVAIYLDGTPISIPIVQGVITDGSAVITGQFSVEEARQLADRMNAGALPVPISLVSQQTIGASLGQESLAASLTAGLWSLLFVALFMVVLYRVPGFASILALVVYVIIVLSIYKLLSITLTLAGIAGFILSLGMAVDANVLIFARMREEIVQGRQLRQAMEEGFRRAWPSIRDSHVTTLISAVILYIFTSSIVRGFGLTLGVGVILSLITSTVITRGFLTLFVESQFNKWRWLFS